MILALDPANKTGWALATLDHELLESGSINLWPAHWKTESERPHKRLARWDAWLNDRLLSSGVKLVAYEAPITHGTHRAGRALAKHLEAVILLLCQEHGIPYAAAAPTSVKAFAAGSGRATKEDMMAAARRLWGYRGSSQDEADALCVLHWALNTQKPEELRGELGMASWDPRVREIIP